MQGWTRTKGDLKRREEEGEEDVNPTLVNKCIKRRGVGRGVVAWGSEGESFLLLSNKSKMEIW